MSVPPASLFIEGGKIMGFLNWIFGTSNEEARRLIALEVKKQQELRQNSAPVEQMDQGDYHSGTTTTSMSAAQNKLELGSKLTLVKQSRLFCTGPQDHRTTGVNGAFRKIRLVCFGQA